MDASRLTRAALLLAVALTVQALRPGQFITGPAVNAILYVSPVLVGLPCGMLVGALTPWGALLMGILSPALAGAVPFIMAGNAALVLVFGLLHVRLGWWAVLPAALVKYLIISVAARRLLGLLPPAAAILGTPQLITAIAGGALAWALLRILKSAVKIPASDHSPRMR